MLSVRKFITLALMACCSFFFLMHDLSLANASSLEYRIIKIYGTLPNVVDYNYTAGLKINNNLQVAGYLSEADTFNEAPALFKEDQIINLATSTFNGKLTAVNDSGSATGWEYFQGPTTFGERSFLYVDGSKQFFNTPVFYCYNGTTPYDPDVKAYDINEAGLAVGVFNVCSSFSMAFKYKNGSFQDIGFPWVGGIAEHSIAHAVNNNGLIVGEARFLDDDGIERIHACIFEESGPRKLDCPAAGESCIAIDVNDNNQIIVQKFAQLSTYLYEAGVYKELTQCSKYQLNTVAKAINNNGDIVGACVMSGSMDSYPFIIKDNNFYFLNGIIQKDDGFIFITSVDSINDRGDVTGTVMTNDYKYYAFVAQPKPTISVPVGAVTILLQDQNP